MVPMSAENSRLWKFCINLVVKSWKSEYTDCLEKCDVACQKGDFDVERLGLSW